MLDENLPAFFLKPSSTGVKHHNEFYLSHHGSDPEPVYHLEHADPASPTATHKNCYAAALFDAYNPDVLFGEVLARPEWVRASGSTEGPGGIPPPPQPVIPAEFTVQLYNPDQQIKVDVKSSKWGGQDSYEFSMPQDVFRTPSASNLDKELSDPASLEYTPRLNFVWRKDGRLNKDLTCFMTGKSTDKKKKSSRKDPDISVALWRQMRELTIYEPNLSRIEMEDPKGLEVVLLLTAVVIKDLYFCPKDQLRDMFNISDGAAHSPKLSSGGRKISNPQVFTTIVGPTARPSRDAGRPVPPPPLQTNLTTNPPPFPDARTQWELDAETARLKAQAEAEAANAHRRRREQEKRDEAERKRLQKMVEEEERAERKKKASKQADVDKETERLRKLYGVTPIPEFRPNPQQQAAPGPGPGPSRPFLTPPGAPGPNGLYVQPSASASNIVMSGANVGSNGLGVPNRPANLKKKSSFWR